MLIQENCHHNPRTVCRYRAEGKKCHPGAPMGMADMAYARGCRDAARSQAPYLA